MAPTRPAPDGTSSIVRSPRGVIVSIVLALLLSGCTGDPGEGPGDDDGTDPDPEPLEATVVPIDLPACRMVEAVALVDAAAARPYVPDGFEVAEQQGRVATVLGAIVCTGDSLSTARAFLAISVTPTHDAFRGDDGMSTFWEPEHIVRNDTGHAEVIDTMGAIYTPSDDLRVERSPTGFRMIAAFAGGTHTIDATGLVAPGPLADQFGHFREYAPAENGTSYLEAQYRASDDTETGSGIATVTTAPDTPARALLGEEATLPVLLADRIVFADARLGFVPWPADAA